MSNYPAGVHDSDFNDDPEGDDYLTREEQEEMADERARAEADMARAEALAEDCFGRIERSIKALDDIERGR